MPFQVGVEMQSSRTSLPYPLLQNRACQFAGTRLLNNRVLVLHTKGLWQTTLTRGSIDLRLQLQHLSFQLAPDEGAPSIRSR